MKTFVLAAATLAVVAGTASAGLTKATPGARGRTVFDMTPYVSVSKVGNRDLGSTNIALTFAADIPSIDGFGDAMNATAVIDLNAIVGGISGTQVTIFGIGWDVTLSAIGPSWLSEPTVLFDDFDDLPAGDPNSIFLSPGAGDDFPGGATNYSSGGIIDLTTVPLGNIVLNNGNLFLEFFEGFDDFANAQDGTWLAGSTLFLNTDAVPAPGAVAVLGLGGLALARRRR